MGEDTVLRSNIIKKAIALFNEKGLKCTMDDVAKACGISKKTIYTVFSDKNDMLIAMVEYLFDGIKEAEQKVLCDNSLDLVGKIRKILGAMPESYMELDFTKLSTLKEKLPDVYAKVSERLESGWDTTVALLEEAKRQGLIREDASIPIFKFMMEATLERFFRDDILSKNKMTYAEGLKQVIDILVDGILVK